MNTQKRKTDASSRLSERVQSLSPSGIRKFFDIISSMDDVISLGVGEPDFVTPWHIREAAINSLENGHTMYTSNSGLLELRQEISSHIRKLYAVNYNPSDEILITVGVSEALDLVMRSILNPGDEVIVPEPTYVSYMPCVSLAGGVPVGVPTYMENSFRVNASDIESKITAKTKAILLGYPNNPTGTVMPRESMQEIADLAVKYDLTVISDEIYDRLVYGVEHVCFSSLPQMKHKSILLGGFSKSYAMTGWRIGYACANSAIIEAMMKIHQYTMLCAPIQGQMAALEALQSGEKAVEYMRLEYDKRRRLMATGLRSLGLDCLDPSGAFYTFPSIRGLGLTSEEFAEQLLIEEKVAVVPGSTFGESGEGHIRCCYAVSEKEIKEALERIDRFVKKLR
jgi:aminotransferase